MRKIIALAGATSALAIISAANATSIGDSFQVTITGTVPGYCTIAGTGTFNVTNGAFSASGKSGNLQIANLGTAGGVVEAVSATGGFQMNANESCAVSLVSSSGGLANQSNSSANKISYSAVIFDSFSTNQNLVPVPAIAGTPFSSFNSHFDPTTLGNETINFGFSITAGGSPVAAGSFSRWPMGQRPKHLVSNTGGLGSCQLDYGIGSDFGASSLAALSFYFWQENSWRHHDLRIC